MVNLYWVGLHFLSFNNNKTKIKLFSFQNMLITFWYLYKTANYMVISQNYVWYGYIIFWRTQITCSTLNWPMFISKLFPGHCLFILPYWIAILIEPRTMYTCHSAVCPMWQDAELKPWGCRTTASRTARCPDHTPQIPHTCLTMPDMDRPDVSTVYL